jgi:hypothetical protein
VAVTSSPTDQLFGVCHVAVIRFLLWGIVISD